MPACNEQTIIAENGVGRKVFCYLPYGHKGKHRGTDFGGSDTTVHEWEVVKSPPALKDYIHEQGLPYTPPTDDCGYTSIKVLEFLNGRMWDNCALAYVHALRPSYIRVVPGAETLDAKEWRVTVRINTDGTIRNIEQEVEVWLPDGIQDGDELDQTISKKLNFVFGKTALQNYIKNDLTEKPIRIIPEHFVKITSGKIKSCDLLKHFDGLVTEVNITAGCDIENYKNHCEVYRDITKLTPDELRAATAAHYEKKKEDTLRTNAKQLGYDTDQSIVTALCEQSRLKHALDVAAKNGARCLSIPISGPINKEHDQDTLLQKYFKVRNLINDLVLNTIEHTIHAPYEKRADLSTFTKYIADEWMQHNEVALFAAMRTEETEMKAEKEEIEKSDVARTSDHIKMSGKRK